LTRPALPFFFAIFVGLFFALDTAESYHTVARPDLGRMAFGTNTLRAGAP
jgi:hypothetical protein